MSTWEWLLLGYMIWFVLAVIRFLIVMGRKNHKDTILDKILIPAGFPVAIIIGFITRITRRN
jgi:hypothetical protein